MLSESREGDFEKLDNTFSKKTVANTLMFNFVTNLQHTEPKLSYN